MGWGPSKDGVWEETGVCGAAIAGKWKSWAGWQQGFPIMARMPPCWGSHRVPHEGAGPQGGLDSLPIAPPSFPLCIPQGVIRAAKELDYEICHGRYTLIVTATDQCPILSRRLTSTTTVGHSPNLGVRGNGAQKAQMGRGVGKDSLGETPKSKSPVLASAAHPNLLCVFEEVNEPL